MLCIDSMLYAARSTDSCILLLHTSGSAASAAPPHRYDYTAYRASISPRAASYNNMIKSPRAYARQIFKTSSFLILNYQGLALILLHFLGATFYAIFGTHVEN